MSAPESGTSAVRGRPFASTHGDGTRGKVAKEYAAWTSMVQRCTNPKNPKYLRYGGRGIRVCDAWLASYESFLQDVGRAPSSGHSVDRIDVDGHYEPGNVRWATQREQQRNRSNNHRFTVGEETKTLAEWALSSGICESTIRQRRRAGWSPERAVTEPVDSVKNWRAKAAS